MKPEPKLGLIERRRARGAWYGINHPTRARITDRGWAALAADLQPTLQPKQPTQRP